MSQRYICDFCDKEFSGNGWYLEERYVRVSTTLAHLCGDCVSRAEWLIEKIKGSNKGE